jgi:hypothetical protein
MATPLHPARTAEVKYYVLGGNTNPYLLARVRWPDVGQAITAGCREWQEDIGLFDLPYDPSSAAVTHAEAEAIAAAWGVRLPADASVKSSVLPLIRRMPSNWSNLSPAEKRAWSLEFVVTGPRAEANRVAPSGRPRRDGWAGPFSRRRSTAAGAERRLHSRVLVGGRAQIHYGRKTVTADLVDVNLGGMHCVVLDTQAVLEAGGKLEAPLVLEGDAFGGPITLEVGGTVTWHSHTGLGTHFGVAFERLNDEQVERVQRLLVTSGAEQAS